MVGRLNVPASPGVLSAVTTAKYNGTSTVRLSTATAAVSHQLMLWSVRIFSGFACDCPLCAAAGLVATVALVMISSPYSQTFSLPLKNFSCTNARIASTMKNVTAFAIW